MFGKVFPRGPHLNTLATKIEKTASAEHFKKVMKNRLMKNTFVCETNVVSFRFGGFLFQCFFGPGCHLATKASKRNKKVIKMYPK
jgi:hypothetical protein